jgi:hypothetical protein
MTTPPATPRTIGALFKERWHRSSRLVFGLALLLLFFCNLPGQFEKYIHYEIGFPFYVKERWVHGWPGTYLVRDAVTHFDDPLAIPPSTVFFYEPTLTDCFSLGRDVVQARWWMLVINIGCVVLAASAIATAFEIWRRERARIWQIHLRDCLVASLVVALAAGWLVQRQRQWAAEAQIRTLRAPDDLPPLWVTYHGGITWLALCFPEHSWPRLFARPFEVQIHDKKGWQYLHHFSAARHVDINVPATTEELAQLTKLPDLEALSYVSLEIKGDFTAELPALPQVRGWYLSAHAQGCRRLDRLSNLEFLRIGEWDIDDVALQEVGQLRGLRHAALNGLWKSADLSFLPDLPQLVAMDFYKSELNGAALRSIGQCSELQDLSFKMCRLECSEVRHLSGLTKLEKLSLEYTDVGDADLSSLGKLKNLRELILTNTKVYSDLRFLTGLERLEYLGLYSTPVQGEA